MSDKHTCEAVVVHCIDFRFRNKLNEYLSGRFLDGYDLISDAGGVKRLVSDTEENNFMMEQLEISHSLHESKLTILIQHEDCGAYGGSEAFESFEAEKAFQGKELEKAELLLTKKFPDSEIERCFIRLSGEVDVIVPAQV